MRAREAAGQPKLVLLFANGCAFAAVLVDAGCATWHRLVPGETCRKVARAANISGATLRAMNPNLNCSRLAVGQELCTSLEQGEAGGQPSTHAVPVPGLV